MVRRGLFELWKAVVVVVTLGTTTEGDGAVTTYTPSGKELGAAMEGGSVQVFNKTGESIGQIYADEYGNGVVGAWNRKGKGRTLKPDMVSPW